MKLSRAAGKKGSLFSNPNSEPFDMPMLMRKRSGQQSFGSFFPAGHAFSGSIQFMLRSTALCQPASTLLRCCSSICGSRLKSIDQI